ncbi:MAG: nucleotidyltransferase family protein [Betaproteobacteria bacterium]|nr:nucleotidyltransferase family protein [Betaproteobacteria bacterium]
MKAMILAAGRGERMRPLTDTTPKPLLRVGGKSLIERHLERLAAAGFQDVVINHAHLGERLIEALGDGSRWGISIAWSAEPPGALETAGGIAQALPLLGPDPFLVLSGDILCEWDFTRAPALAQRLARAGAHLVLTANPEDHPGGDFSLDGATLRPAIAGKALTYANIGVFSPAFFAPVKPGQFLKLRPLLDAAIADGRITGEEYHGRWHNIGTPELLARCERDLEAESRAEST